MSDEDATLVVERHRVLDREHPERAALAERDALLEREPRQRAVHRARVEVAEAEPLCERAGDGALAGSSRSVDGDDHRSATESRRS